MASRQGHKRTFPRADPRPAQYLSDCRHVSGIPVEGTFRQQALSYKIQRSKTNNAGLGRTDFTMSFKATGCKACRFRSCCDLAERNARLWLQGKVTKERFQELTQDLHNTCHIAGIYQDWLVSSLQSDLPLTSSKRFHTKAKDRKKLLQQCLAIH